mmetsp:Transcript_60798/g.130660  ORF Transcript_60798/g.130660 Transcript_60798/m.130660 type:complete len:234 (+) Transcript_60798:191-892(+)
MASYASCTADKDCEKAIPVPSKPKGISGPIFLENPDGTITEAVPSSLREAACHKPGRRFGRRRSADSDTEDSGTSASEDSTTIITREVDFLVTRHEFMLGALLATQLCLEVLYNIVYVTRMRDGTSVKEFQRMYLWKSKSAIETIFWFVFGMQLVYSLVYYGIAAYALRMKKPKYYGLFASYGACGLVGFVFLAYIDKFNLVSFFLHLLNVIYSRFLHGLTANLLLLPPLSTA